MRTRVQSFIVASLMAGFACFSAFAQTPLTQKFTLAWSKNPESNIDHYRLHIGTASREYTIHVPVGSGTNCITPDLPVGPVFYFSLTAVNTVGLESEYSAEISSAAGPQITAGLAGNGLQLSIQARPGQTCAIETSQNLRDWLFVTNRIADLQGQVRWSPTSAGASNPMGFFRARTQ